MVAQAYSPCSTWWHIPYLLGVGRVLLFHSFRSRATSLVTTTSVMSSLSCWCHVFLGRPRRLAPGIARFVTLRVTFPANMLTLGQRRQALALERQRRRRGDDVGQTLFRRRLATSHDDDKPTSGDDVGSTLFRRRLATSQYDAKPTSGDDVGSTLFPRR